MEEHISDHFPLLATFDLDWEFPPPPHDVRLRYQFASEDWSAFQRAVDRALDPELARHLSSVPTIGTSGARA